MGENINGDTKVTYTVKELLGEIRTDVKEIMAKLDTKADRAEVIKLGSDIATELDDHEHRIQTLEAEDAGERKVSAFKAGMWGFLGGLAISLVNFLNNLFHIVQIGGNSR